MRWHDVVRAVASAAVADPDVSAVFSTSVRESGFHEVLRPVLQYRVITDTVDELWEPCTIQWEMWTSSMSDLVAGELALRNLFDKEDPVTIEGVYMWSQYEDGAELGQLTGVGPDRMNLYGRATRFRHVPIRQSLRAGRST